MDKLKQRQLTSRLFIGLSVLFIFLAGWLVGSYSERSRTALDLSKFWHVYSIIKDKYPGDIDQQKAVDGAIQGLVNSLGDPFSSYLNTEEKKHLEEDLSGQFEGIGAVLTEKNDQTVVVEVLEDSPALKAGLKKGDIITGVDGTKTAGLVLDEVVSMIRGPKGSQVTLTILRNKQEQKIEIERGSIAVNSVKYRKDGDIGIVTISQFGDDTADGVKKALEDLEKQGVGKYLIDLRDNPGGYLGVVGRVTSYFLPPGSVVVKEKYQGGKTDEVKTDVAPIVPDKPIYVFINGGSASAAEILAGALQDYKRAVLIGEKSYGKGSVQDIINLRGNTALRITIAEWLTPKDRHINKLGIKPDHKITGKSYTEELNKAINYIRSK